MINSNFKMSCEEGEMETAKEMEKKEEKREGVAYEKKGGKKGD